MEQAKDRAGKDVGLAPRFAEATTEPRVERSRCPFCREDVLSTQNVAACEACLARHHGACWAESSACATCGHGVALTRAGEVTRGRARRRMPALLLVLVGLPLLAMSALRLTEERQRAEAARAREVRHTVEAAATAADVAERAQEYAAALKASERYVLRRLGVEFTQGRILHCSAVRAGTPADQRLRAGDRIESVDGVAVVDVHDLVARLRGRDVVRVGARHVDGDPSDGSGASSVYELKLAPEPPVPVE